MPPSDADSDTEIQALEASLATKKQAWKSEGHLGGQGQG